MPKTVLLQSGELELLEICKAEMDRLYEGSMAEIQGIPHYYEGERVWPRPEQAWVIVNRASHESFSRSATS